jgi:hypothetical protein
MTIDQPLRHVDDVLRLLAEHAERREEAFHIGHASCREPGRVRVVLEQARRNLVDRHVGCLGAQNCGYQEFESVSMIEFTVGIGVSRSEQPERLEDV